MRKGNYRHFHQRDDGSAVLLSPERPSRGLFRCHGNIVETGFRGRCPRTTRLGHNSGSRPLRRWGINEEKEIFRFFRFIMPMCRNFPRRLQHDTLVQPQRTDRRVGAVRHHCGHRAHADRHYSRLHHGFLVSLNVQSIQYKIDLYAEME